MKKNEIVPNLDFLCDGDNVYLTKHYIVKQEIEVIRSDLGEAMSFSQDTYYLRTEERDSYFKIVFADRKNIDGKRLSVSTYIRKYID